MKHLKHWATAVAALTLAGAASAALVDRGNGLIYDSTQNLTWMSNLRPAVQGVYGVDGMMTWSQARTWADSLVFGGYDDWRLPEVNPADATCTAYLDAGGGWGLQSYGYNCSQGELSHLSYVDLGLDYHNLLGDTAEQLANRSLFTGYGPLAYWTGSSYAPDPSQAWGFNLGTGFQRMAPKETGLMVMAVRDGDVVATVPAPASLGLVVLGLAAAAAARINRAPGRRP